MKNYFTLILAIIIVIAANSQKRFDLFYAAGNYNLMNTTDANPEENGELAYMGQLRLPIVFKNNNVWFNQIDYHNFSIFNEYENTTLDNIKKFNVHGFILRTGYIYRINENKSLQMFFSPRFMSDFNASFSDALQFGGVLLFEKIKNENYTWKIGALYNQEYFGSYLVPVFDINWKINNKLRLSGLIPVYGSFYIEPSEKFQAGLHFIGLTTSYRIFEPKFENYYLDRRSIDVSFFSKVLLFDNIFLTGRVGYSLLRDYGLYAEDDKMSFALPLLDIGDDRTRANNEFDGSPFFHLRLIYSIPIED